MSVKPVNIQDLKQGSENQYELVAAVSLRAKQLNEELRSELEEKLSPFQVRVKNPTNEGEADKVFPEQVAISIKYEKMPKPTQLALEEYKERKYGFYYPESAGRRR
ncbi:MAG: hypothetical protein HGB19_02635 [Chlorobiales bacterium]|jgi:DNA-directed RNA polymerase subunit K/omega|nr:hypothetical protein [Chlorobiales bacterium]